MDYILYFLIMKNEFEKLNLEEIMVKWGGEVFSQNPPKYRFLSEVVFFEIFEENYFKKEVGDILNIADYRILALEGNLLGDLILEVNNKNNKNSENKLICFFHELFKSLDTYCVIKLRDEECIDDRYILSDANEIRDTFIKSLKWDTRKGIIIIKKDN